MKILKEIDRQTFTERFGTKEQCYQYLAELKWGDSYSCKRCESQIYIKGAKF